MKPSRRFHAVVLGAGISLGCAHTSPPTTPTTGSDVPRLLASVGSGLPPSAAPILTRAGLIVTMTICWYPTSATATVAEAAPRLEPRQCRVVGERVVMDLPDADTSARAERYTIEDVALKAERPGTDAADE